MTAGLVVERRARYARSAGWIWGPLVASLSPFVALTAVAAANGGFNNTSFGWTALAFAWFAVVALIVSKPSLGLFDLAWLASAAALSIFVFASAAWAGSAADAVDDGLRSLVYLTGALGALLVLRRGRLTLWLGGIACAATGVSIYALATRLFPDRFSGAFNADAAYRLFVPVGYWNALGVFVAIAALTAVGVAAFGRARVIRIAAAVALVPLSATQYFTFSRGAWLALVIGTLATIALSSRRLRLFGAIAGLVPVPAIGVFVASRSSALTHSSVTLAAASHAGHRVTIELLLLAILQLGIAGAYVLGLARLEVATAGRRVAAAALVVVALVGLVAVFARYGSPSTLARHGYDSFVSPPTGGSDLNGRLFSLSNNGRTVLWRAALDDFEAHPFAGSGAGSYGRWWLAHRNSDYFVKDAHNLYLQTLAEGGILGAGLLAAFLGVPLAAAFRARRHPLVAPAFGGYVAFLAHAVVDWDWQMPAVTLTALFLGAALVAAARSRDPKPLLPTVRGGIGLATGIVALVAFIGLIGNLALAHSRSAALDGRPQKALASAEKAHRWEPWSAVALRQLGESRVLAGERTAGLRDLRSALAKDPGDWQGWYDVASVTAGQERRQAVARARALNPFAPDLIKSG